MNTLGKVSLILVFFFGGTSLPSAHMGERFVPDGWYNMGFSISGPALSKEQTARIVQAHVLVMADPKAMVGGPVEFESHFEAAILARDSSCPEKILVDKTPDWLRSVS